MESYILQFSFFEFLLNTSHYILCSVPFFPDLRVKKRTILGMIIATSVVMAVVSSHLRVFVPNWRQLDMPITLLFYVIYLIQYICYFNISVFKLLYIFFLVQAYSTMLNVIGKFIDVSLFPAQLQGMEITSYALIVIGLMILTYPFLFLFFKNTFSKVFHEYPDRRFWKLCITPALFFAINMIYNAILLQQIFAEIELLVIFILILVTGFITYYLTLRTGVDIANFIQVRTKMESQIALQAQRYKQLTETIEHTRAARHDLRHHLSVIASFVVGDDKAGLEKYLNEYMVNLPVDTISPLCQNYTVDVVARHYLAMAQQAGAELDIKIQLPQEAGIPDSVLCIVFGNILENAVKSCARQTAEHKFIRVRCETTNDHIVLVVDNSGDEIPVKSKTDRYKDEGVGLCSVRSVAKQYGGTLNFKRKDGVYHTSVMMMSDKH